MTRLKPEQLARLRKPFDKVGAFEGKTEKEVEQALNGVMDYYLTLARINLRLKQEKRNETTHPYNRD